MNKLYLITILALTLLTVLVLADPTSTSNLDDSKDIIPIVGARNISCDSGWRFIDSSIYANHYACADYSNPDGEIQYKVCDEVYTATVMIDRVKRTVPNYYCYEGQIITKDKTRVVYNANNKKYICEYHKLSQYVMCQAGAVRTYLGELI